MNNEMMTQIAETVAKELRKKTNSQGMSLKLAKKLIEAVEKKASEIGVNAVVAISDIGARPVAIECMDDSYIASFDVALNKAYTVVALKMPTIKLKGLAQPGESLYGIQFTNGGQIVIFGGGDPLVYNGKIIGGIGVSGGTEEQDTFLSAYGAEQLEKIIKEI